MSSLREYFESEFNTQREQWETTLMRELKLTEVGTKDVRRLLSGGAWPTLSLAADPVYLGAASSWKKASNTYSHLEKSEIRAVLEEDLEHGVKNFFFYSHAMDADKWGEVERTLEAFSSPEELEVFFIGEHVQNFTSSKFKVITHLITGQWSHDLGGHTIQELGLLAVNLIHEMESSTAKEFYLGVYLDSQFFHNIAKVRALKLLAYKISESFGGTKSFKIVALTSYREWTLFERYSNILRNETSVAAAYIAGADHIQSSGYNTILELESLEIKKEDHIERSRRLSRNTSHILALESMLGVVEDASCGSYHLDSLTEKLASESWGYMQTLIPFKPSDLKVHMETETSVIREKRLDMLKSRRFVMSGINDFPDVKERLDLKLRESSLFRAGRIFEDLRLRVEALTARPEVYIALYGDYGSTNPRITFVKNYFELLGLTVHAPVKSVENREEFRKDLLLRKEEVIVVCALDAKYTEINEVMSGLKIKEKFIAGKVEVAGFKNLYAGQNIYDVLRDLVKGLCGEEV